MSNRDAVDQRIVRLLLERVRLETERLAWWWAIRDACGSAGNATESDVFLYEPRKRRLRRVEYTTNSGTASPFRLGPSMPTTTDHAPARAVRSGAVVDAARPNGGYEFAVPVQRPFAGEASATPLAVIALRYDQLAAHLRSAARARVLSLITQVWPLSVYASIRDLSPMHSEFTELRRGELDVAHVLEGILDTLCDRMGFEFAAICLVDTEAQEVIARAARGVDSSSRAAVPYPVDAASIQASILRSGVPQVLRSGGPDFGMAADQHSDWDSMTRVFLPLGQVGTIEAGFHRRELTDSDRILISVVERYAHDATVLIQYALIQESYASERAHASALAELHRVTSQLQTPTRVGEQHEILGEITQAAHKVLRASIVMLYPTDRATGWLSEPILAGDVKENKKLSKPDDENIVYHINRTTKPYYQEDVASDPLLTSLGSLHSDQHRDQGTKIRTFTERQDIRSFAGVPLMVQESSYGVLCVNYRERHQFNAPR